MHPIVDKGSDQLSLIFGVNRDHTCFGLRASAQWLVVEHLQQLLYNLS